MGEMEEKLGAILNNPQMMQQIMSMAQTLGQSQGQPPEQSKPEPPPQQQMTPAFSGGMNPAMLQRVIGLAKQSGIDKNQQNLLKALGPYLSRERIMKLEKAMRAAKIASLAATALRSSGMLSYSGR